MMIVRLVTTTTTTTVVVAAKLIYVFVKEMSVKWAIGEDGFSGAHILQ